MILEELERVLLSGHPCLCDEDFILRGVWRIDMAFSPTPFDPAFHDIVVIAQTTGTGFCTCYDEQPAILSEWIGRDVREICIPSRGLRIAILDAVYEHLVKSPAYSTTLEGPPSRKGIGRASIVAYEILRLLPSQHTCPARVHIVGAVGSIISELSKSSVNISATDLDRSIIGTAMGGVTIEDGQLHTVSRLEEADVALVTGMAISTDTIDDVLLVCKNSNTKTVVFAQTGANFASKYIEYGFDTVVAESFPNYIFPGSSAIRVFRGAPN